ncbi:unnamed protein product [Jaminaea pallidilutea]
MDDDDWQEMPVVHSAGDGSTGGGGYSAGYGGPADDSSDSDSEAGPSRRRQKRFSHHRKDSKVNAGASTASTSGQHAPTTNATGTSLGVRDARGFDWRAKPSSAPGMAENRDREDSNNPDDSDDEDEDDEKGKGYTQLRLDEDVEGDELHAATEYLFGDAHAQGGSKGPVESSVGYSYQGESTATPLSQMTTTKSMLSDPQKIAYVGLCSLKAKEMVRALKRIPGSSKDLAASLKSTEEWEVRVLARLFQHMDIDASEQKMIQSLGEHGVLAADLAPSLVTTQKIENPDYDPLAAEEQAEAEANAEAKGMKEADAKDRTDAAGSAETDADQTTADEQLPVPRDSGDDVAEGEGNDGDLGGSISPEPTSQAGARRDEPPSTQPDQLSTADKAEDGDIASAGDGATTPTPATPKAEQESPTLSPSSAHAGPRLADPNTAAQAAAAEANINAGAQSQLGLTSEPQSVQPPPNALPGVTTALSTTDTHITLDLRWTILCDLFLVLTADSVYDARSRVLLERVAEQLGLTWMDVTKFEKRVTDALEIEEGIERLKDKSTLTRREREAKRRKWAMVGLATVGGGLVIGLSAGLAAPLVGAGLAGFLGTVGVGGTSGFLAGAGGAALITTTGTAAGAALGGRGMTRRTQSVRTFMFKPIHNNKRINCIVTVPGFMNGPLDDVRLPFSVIDSVMGDVFSVLWEPEMMREMGNAIYILYNETLIAGVQSVLAATIAGGLLGALAWPLWLTKLGYLIDNPWSNACTRAEAAGKILADVLYARQLGVRPITLVGFSLGARAIFYALVELAKKKAFGIIQNVYIFGTPVAASDKVWKEIRSIVAGRFVNGFSRTDWILGYLFRATSGGLRSIAGLHPVERVPDVENVDVTTSVPGHLQYRAFMPLVMSEVGFRVTQDWFDEPEDLSKIPDREVVLQEIEDKKRELELKAANNQGSGFANKWKHGQTSTPGGGGSSTPTPSATAGGEKGAGGDDDDDDLPPREEHADDEDDLPPREEHPVPEGKTEVEAGKGPADLEPVGAAAAEQIERAATPEAERPPDHSAHFNTQAILAELRDGGIEVKELESSMPALDLKDQLKASSTPEPATQQEQSMRQSAAQPSAPAAAPPRTPTLPAAQPRRMGLKASMASFFTRRSSTTPASSRAESPAPATQPTTPTLAAPSSAYTSNSAAAASRMAEKGAASMPSTPTIDEAVPGGQQPWNPSTAPATKSWDRPYNVSSGSFSSTDTSRLPPAPPSYAANNDLNLSFASDFDDGEGEADKDAAQNGGSANAQTYGLSANEAQDLARRFGEPSLSPTATSQGAFGREEGFGGNDWGQPSSETTTADTMGSAWGRTASSDNSSGPSPAGLGFSSASTSDAASTIRPLETSYGTYSRQRSTSSAVATPLDELMTAGTSGDGFFPSSAAARAMTSSTENNSAPQRPQQSGSRGGNMFSYSEATENPWG